MTSGLTRTPSLVELAVSNAPVFIGLSLIFAIIGLLVAALLPTDAIARSTVQVPNAAFEFKTIASGHDVAARVAARIKFPGSADAAQKAIDIEPISAPFAFTTAYPTLLSITTAAPSPQMAMDMNTAVVNDTFVMFSQVNGPGSSFSIIDKPYIVPVSRTREMTRYSLAGLFIGLVIAYAWAYLRLKTVNTST